jgi:molybdate transport system substrate-binding protein
VSMRAIRKLEMWKRIQASTKATVAAAIVAVALMQLCTPARCAEIEVFSSAAPRGVLRELTPDFERTTGHSLVVHYEFSTDLKRRIEAGDPFDVAILPPEVADDLIRRGKLAAGSRIELARTGLGVAIRRGAPKPDIGTADEFRRTLLAARTVAYSDGRTTGGQVRSMLARLGIAETMTPKMRPYPSGGALEALARGEADLVVIGISPILDAPGVELAGWLPPDLQSYVVVFTASISAEAKEPDAARALLSTLVSPAAVELFKARGFEPALP